MVGRYKEMSKLGFEFEGTQSDADFIISDTSEGIKIILSGSMNVMDPMEEFIPFYEKIHVSLNKFRKSCLEF